MLTDADLAAIRARWPHTAAHTDVHALLTALDAAVAERDALRKAAWRLITEAVWGDVVPGHGHKVEVRDPDMDKLSAVAGPVPKDFDE